jgi:hypothetical protein
MRLPVSVLKMVRGASSGAVLVMAGCGSSAAIAFPEKPADYVETQQVQIAEVQVTETQVTETEVTETEVVPVEHEEFTPDETAVQHYDYENLPRPCGRG